MGVADRGAWVFGGGRAPWCLWCGNDDLDFDPQSLLCVCGFDVT
jgi:hypothetical protein